MAWDQLTDDQRAKLEHAATIASAHQGRTVTAQDLLEAAERAASATIEAVTGSQGRGAGMSRSMAALDVGPVSTPPYTT
jgi:phosphoribosylcarboxyaminoimidazole (NCAIR) mutase